MSSTLTKDPADEAEAALQATLVGPAILDLAGLYRYSGLLDNLRDSALALLSTAGKESKSVHMDSLRNVEDSLVATYQDLSARFPAIVREDLREDLAAWTDKLEIGTQDVRGSSLQEIYIAASKLSRWLDVTHSTAKFLLSQRIADAEAAMAGHAMEAKMNEMGFSGVAIGAGGFAPGDPRVSTGKLVGFQANAAPEDAAKTGFYM